MLTTSDTIGRTPARRARRGFTLLETGLTIVIVGTGVIAMMAAQQAFHQKNDWSTHASTAAQIGNEIREMTFNLPRHDPVTGEDFWGPEDNELSVEDFDDLDDFDGDGDGLIFSAALGNGPLNARRAIIPNMTGWSQTVRVFNVDPFDITSVEADGSTPMLMVEVVVEYQSPRDLVPNEITRITWLAPQ
jgi:type II secretory pathway pseudopilin PulG